MMIKKITTCGKILVVITFLAVILYPFFEVSVANAQVSDNDVVEVGVTVGTTIGITDPADVTLGTITGTGASSEGTALWTVTTNNSAGYKLEWQASVAAMASGADTIAAYGPSGADTPETWSVAAADSEWGARLKSASTDSDAEWGTDGASEKWLNVNHSAVRQIVSRATETAGGGSDETVAFKAEVGASHFQESGDYTVNVTVTATTL